MTLGGRCIGMGYVKAGDVLPPEMIEQIQQYVEGKVLYIPKRAEEKAAWGKGTSTKAELAERNARIYAEFLDGASVSALAKDYFLVEKSIQRIIRQEKNRKSGLSV